MLMSTLIKTRKNGPLADVFSQLPFSVIEESDTCIGYCMMLPVRLGQEAIVEVIDATG
jgi:hypothetical protein